MFLWRIFFIFRINFLQKLFRKYSLSWRQWIKNNDETYYEWRNKFYFPIQSFWIFIFPLFCLGKLIRNAKKLPQLKLFFGFLYLGYKPLYYYWEFLIIYRKIFSILVILLPNEMIFFKGCIIFMLNFSSAILQINKEPFTDPTLNKFQVKANLASTFTIFFGLLYLLDIDDLSKALCFVIIMICNYYFLLSCLKFLFYIVLELIIENKLIKKWCPQLTKRMLSCLIGKFLILIKLIFKKHWIIWILKKLLEKTDCECLQI